MTKRVRTRPMRPVAVLRFRMRKITMIMIVSKGLMFIGMKCVSSAAKMLGGYARG